jgi:hypothetical protein
MRYAAEARQKPPLSLRRAETLGVYQVGCGPQLFFAVYY